MTSLGFGKGNLIVELKREEVRSGPQYFFCIDLLKMVQRDEQKEKQNLWLDLAPFLI